MRRHHQSDPFRRDVAGTNTVTGTFNFFSGTVGGGVLTVAPTGLLILGESNYDNYALFYDLSLVNNGEVVWRGGSVSCSGSTITNNNLWLMQGGSEM